MKKEALIFHYFPQLSITQQAQLKKLGPLYNFWNKQLNLISRKDIEQLYIRHVLHSLSIAKLIRFKASTKILDIGTGGGFPSIPLAILYPKAQFYLIDSVGKKVKAVQAIANALSLTNIHTQQIRAEKVQGQYEFILGRAVTNLPTFYNWVKDNLARDSKNNLPNGILYLKGGDFEDELGSLPLQYTIYPIQHFFTAPFFETKKIIHLYLG